MPNEYTTLEHGLIVRVERAEQLGCDILSVRIYSRYGYGRNDEAVAEPLSMKTLSEEDKHVWRPPVFTMSPHTAQKLMDDLWHCGLRPSEGTGSAGALAATQKHLEDMKRVAFHALKIK